MTSFETTTELLPHQRDAVAKILPSRVGALFMDMGTGKSRTAIELARIRAAKIDRVVWCCPYSLRETVRRQIMEHTDCEDIYIFGDKTNEQSVDTSARWVVVGLESIGGSDRAALTLNSIITDSSMVIVDESQLIKGHRSKRTERVTAYSKRARYRLILTGTPITQGVQDLYAQMRFLSPKILGYNSWYTFAANHIEYDEERTGRIKAVHNTDVIAAKIKPYVYQVRKDECLTLPDKMYYKEYAELTLEQREAYDAVKDEFFAAASEYEFGGEPIPAYLIFQMFSKLQSVVCGFVREGDKQRFFEHRRVEALQSVISRIPDNEKVIIWAKYLHCTDEIVEALGRDNCAIFTGAIDAKQRDIELADFRAYKRFFVATQSCGGQGLTLNEANHVIFYADSFKYAERLQAEDRCHRIGQTKAVTYISLYSDGGIDDLISRNLTRKGNIVAAFREDVQKIRGAGMRDKLRKLVAAL